MRITVVQLKLLRDTGTKLKAIASLTFDDMFVVHDIKVLQNDNVLFIAMPSKSKKISGFQDIVHPINHETREAMENIIFAVYRRAIEESRVLIEVRMALSKEDNIITQSCDKYEIVSDQNIMQSKSYSENAVQKTLSDISENNEFIRWLKK